MLVVGGLAVGIGAAGAIPLGATCDSAIGVNADPTPSPNVGAATCVRADPVSVATNTVFYPSGGSRLGGVVQMCVGYNLPNDNVKGCNTNPVLMSTGAFVPVPAVSPDTGPKPGGRAGTGSNDTCVHVNDTDGTCQGGVEVVDVGVDAADLVPVVGTPPSGFCLVANGSTCLHPGVTVKVGQGSGSELSVAEQPVPANVPATCVGLLAGAAVQLNPPGC